MRTYLFVTIFLMGFISSAQVDSVLLNNGLKSVIKVLAINSDDITYKIPSETDGKVYALRKSEIKKLYLNTPVSQLGNPNANIPAERISSGSNSGGGKSLEDFKLNYLGFNVGQMIYNTVSFNYQRLEKSGVMGVRVFTSFNLAPKDRDIQVYHYYSGTSVNMPTYRKFTGGLEMNYFPLGQRRLSWYTGPSVQLGVFNYVYSDQACVDSVNNSTSYYNGNYYNNSHDYSPCKRKGKNGINTSVMVNTGILWRVTPSFFLDSSFGLGAQRIVFGSVQDEVKIKASLQVLIGYSF